MSPRPSSKDAMPLTEIISAPYAGTKGLVEKILGAAKTWTTLFIGIVALYYFLTLWGNWAALDNWQTTHGIEQIRAHLLNLTELLFTAGVFVLFVLITSTYVRRYGFSNLMWVSGPLSIMAVAALVSYIIYALKWDGPANSTNFVPVTGKFFGARAQNIYNPQSTNFILAILGGMILARAT